MKSNKETVVIDKDNYKIKELEFDEIHSTSMLELAKEYGLTPDKADHLGIGIFLRNNGFLTMQIAPYFSIVYIPNDINNYQIEIAKSFLYPDSEYIIIDDRHNSEYEENLSYVELLDYLDNTKKIVK